MAVAWALVALAEWAAAAKRSRWRLDEVAPPVVVPGPDAADSTGPWDMPVVEATAIDVAPASASESKTIVTKLPADARRGARSPRPSPSAAPPSAAWACGGASSPPRQAPPIPGRHVASPGDWGRGVIYRIRKR